MKIPKVKKPEEREVIFLRVPKSVKQWLETSKKKEGYGDVTSYIIAILNSYKESIQDAKKAE